jgi:cytochrome c
MKPARSLFIGLMGAACLIGVSVAAENPAASSAAESRGKELFARRCSGCHAVDINKEGPRLRGVFGRRTADVADFAYSDGLKKLGLRWDETSLDRWLSDPEAMVPDTDMAFRMADGGERRAVIAYLRSLGEK